MTVSSTTRKAGPFAGTGSAVSHPFAFKVFASTDVLVVRTTSVGDTTLTLNTDYAVTLNADQDANPGGSIALVTVLEVGESVTLSSRVPALQNTDLQSGGGWYPKTIEDALDRVTVLLQQLALVQAGTVQLSITTATGVSTTLPPPVANRLIGWDAAGTGLVNQDPASVVTDNTAGLRTDLATGATGKGAHMVALQDTGGHWDAATVEALAAEIKAKIRKPVVSAVALAAALALGGGLRIADGVYTLTSALAMDYSSTSFPEPGNSSIRCDIVGDSRANTILRQTTSGAVGIHAIGRADAVYQGVHGVDEISHLTMTRSGAGLNTGTGIKIEHKAYTKVSDAVISYHGNGLWLNGVLSSIVENCYITKNAVGLVTDFSGAALLPNAISVKQCQLADNSTAGMVGNVLGCTFRMEGGSVENNGATGLSNGGGIFANLSGANGTASAVLDGVYFEANGGVADIVFTNTTGHHLTVTLIGCVFNRVLASRYVTQHIKAANTGGGSLRIVMVGCGFLSSGDYVPDSARPLWSGDSACEFVDLGNTYAEGTSRPSSCRSTSGPVSGAVIESNGAAISTLPPGVSVTRTGTGVYRVVKAGAGWALDTFGYTAMANAMSNANRACCLHVSNTTFDVYTVNAAGAAVDERFSFNVHSFH